MENGVRDSDREADQVQPGNTVDLDDVILNRFDLIGDDQYAMAARVAMRAYAGAIEVTNPGLAERIVEVVHDEDVKAHAQSKKSKN